MQRTVESPTVVTPKEILFADRFSPDSSKALGYVCAVASRFGSHVTVAHVSESVSPIDIPEGCSLEALGFVVLDSDMHLQHRLEEFKGKGIRADKLVLYGNVDQEVLRAAKERSAHLMILGTHAPHGIDRLFFGSESESVACLGGWPVMIVGPSARSAPNGKWSPESLLCILDQAEHSVNAAAYAIYLAQTLRAKVRFLLASNSSRTAEEFTITMNERFPGADLWRSIPREFAGPDRILARALEIAGEPSVGAIVLCAEVGSRFSRHLHRGLLANLLADAACPVIVTARGSEQIQLLAG